MLLSIVVPVYNRAAQIGRCLGSVLGQEFADYELILIDDASTDDSLERMRAFSDPRLRIVTHELNRGTGAARNSGIDASRGEWIVFLDSDDELVSGALQTIARLAAQVPARIAAMWFRCRMDDGYLSPPRLTAPREWDYAGFVRFWGESSGEWRDVLQCFRRDCFSALRQPEGQADDVKFLLDFAKKFPIHAYPDVLLLYHQDAGNQTVNITSRLDPRKDRLFILDRANEYRDLLHAHGDFVAREAPGLYGEYLQSAATTATMANRRAEAFSYAIDLIRLEPRRARNWALLAASLIGPWAAILRRWITAD